jgi:cytochrome c-type biogenesis protein CcmH
MAPSDHAAGVATNGDRSAASLLGAVLLAAAIAAAAAAALRTPMPRMEVAPASAEGPRDAHRYREALVRFLDSHPRDGRGWVLLAMAELDAERWAGAAAAFEKAVSVSSKVAADPAIWCEWADALGMAQGGRLAGRPTELIERALALKPQHAKALEMAGSAAYERRDFRLAAGYWQRLLAQLPAGSPAHGELSAAIARAERLARTALPPG